MVLSINVAVAELESFSPLQCVALSQRDSKNIYIIVALKCVCTEVVSDHKSHVGKWVKTKWKLKKNEMYVTNRPIWGMRSACVSVVEWNTRGSSSIRAAIITAYLIIGEPIAGECQSEEQVDEILTGYSTKTIGLIGRLSFKIQQLVGFAAAHQGCWKVELVWKLLRRKGPSALHLVSKVYMIMSVKLAD